MFALFFNRKQRWETIFAVKRKSLQTLEADCKTNQINKEKLELKVYTYSGDIDINWLSVSEHSLQTNAHRLKS